MTTKQETAVFHAVVNAVPPVSLGNISKAAGLSEADTDRVLARLELAGKVDQKRGAYHLTAVGRALAEREGLTVGGKAAPTRKGYSVKKRGTTKRAQPVRDSHPVAREVCSTRFMDSRTGRFVPTPKTPPRPALKARAVDYRLPTLSRDDNLSVLKISEKGGAVKSIKVRDLSAREKARTVKGKTARRSAWSSVKKTERDLALIERDGLGLVDQDDHNEAMRDAHNSDKAKRGAASRRRNAAAREADRANNPYKYAKKGAVIEGKRGPGKTAAAKKATGRGGRA